MFWQIMAPNAGGEPTNRRRDYGKLWHFGFKQRFNDAGTKQFGSGWVWLVRTPDGRLKYKYAQPRQSNIW